MLNEMKIVFVLKACPSDNEGLSAPVRTVYDAWNALTIPQLLRLTRVIS